MQRFFKPLAEKLEDRILLANDFFPSTFAQLLLVPPGAAQIPIPLSGPTNVFVDIPLDGSAGDSNNNGRDDVQIELTEMQLQGDSPFGPVLVTQSSQLSSLGLIEEQVNNTPSVLDLPPYTATGTADSVINLFFDVEIGGQVFHNEDALVIQTQISRQPVAQGETFLSQGPVDLFDAAGNPTGFQIDEVFHTPSPDPIEIDIFERSVGQLLLEIDNTPLGTVQQLVSTVGPAKVNVFFEGANEGDAGDDDGNNRDEVLTQMVDLEFRGHTPLGPVHIFLDQSQLSLGQIEELVNNTPGLLDVDPFAPGAADSFFDINFLVDLNGQLLAPATTTRLTSVIQSKPPENGERYIFNPPQPVDLIDVATGLPVGIRIVREIHDEDPTVEHDVFPRTIGQLLVEVPLPPGLITDDPGLPPEDGEYRTASQVHAEFQGPALQVVLKDIRHRVVAGSTVRIQSGLDEIERFDSTLRGTAIIDGVAFPVDLTGPVEVLSRGKVGNTTGTFQTEMISMSLTGQVPGGPTIVIRESPSLPSPGQTTITDLGNGRFQIDSFFDIWTEVSIDGGPFTPSVDSARVGLVQPGIRTPDPELPPSDGVYRTAADVHAEFQGPDLEIVLQDIRHRPFADRIVRTSIGPDELEQFNSSLTGTAVVTSVGLGLDGVHVPVELAGPVEVLTRGKVGNTTGTFQTEMISMSLSGDVPLPGGGTVPITIQESPTLPSPGEVTIQNLSDRTFQIDSFFDVFTEVSLAGGPFIPSTDAAQVELVPAPQLITTAGLSQVDVYFEGPNEGDATDDNGDGLDEVVSELVRADFDGFHPLLGPVEIRLRDDLPSLGLITERVNDNPGRLDVDPFAPGAADSFFDVFFEVHVPATGQTLVTQGPTRVQSVIENKPPQDGERYIFNPPQPVELFVRDPFTGQLTPTGIFIVREIHDENPTVEEDHFPMSIGELLIEMPDGLGGTIQETVTTSGPSTVHVYFEGPAEGDASDDDGDGLDEVTSEIVQLDLAGFHPLLGPVEIRLRDDLPALGLITEQVNNTAGLLDVDPFAPGAADSFFDVFFEIHLPATGQTLVTAAPTRVAAVIDDKPPEGNEQYIFNPLQPVELIDAATGLGTGIFLVQEIHTPNPPSIHGQKFEDLNGDGVRDPGEPGLPGWTIILFDEFGNPVATQTTMDNDPTTPEDETGWYWFTDLLPGHYTVGEILPPEHWIQTAPSAHEPNDATGPAAGFIDSAFDLELAPGVHDIWLAANDKITDAHFGNAVKGSIHGYKFEDLNVNGIDDGEPRLEGVTIQLRDPNSLDGFVETWDDGGNDWQYWVKDVEDISPDPSGGRNEPSQWSATGGVNDSGYILAPLDHLFETDGNFWPAFMAPPDPVADVDLDGQTVRIHVTDFDNSNLPDSALRFFVGEFIDADNFAFYAHHTPIEIGTDWVQTSFDIGGDENWVPIVVGSASTTQPSDLYHNPQQWGFTLMGEQLVAPPSGVLAFDELQIVTEIIQTTTTDVDGEYWFTKLFPGDYKVAEIPPVGTFPTTPTSFDVTLLSRQELVALPGQAMLPSATFAFPLSGAQEVPPSSSTASGVCVGILSGDQATFELTCTHDVASPVAAHIHGPAPAGTNAGVLFNLGDPSSPIDAAWNLSPTDVAELFAGNLYVNVHSGQFPAGEIRGQIVNPRPDPRVEVVIGPQLAFGNAFEGSIHGYKFEDLNANGIDDGEPRLQGIEIVLRRLTPTFPVEVDRMRTDVNGEYWFEWLEPGQTYIVEEVPPAGSFQTTPDPAPIFIGSGQEYVALGGQSINSPMLRPDVPGDGYLEFINLTEHPGLVGTIVPTSPPGVIMTEEFTGFTLANGNDVIEMGDSDTTAGDRADFDWVQENRPVETGFPPGGNHPGMVGAMGWTVGTPEMSPHIDPGSGLAHGHSDEETPPGPLPHLDNRTYTDRFFAAVDVFSIISVGQDSDSDASGVFSRREAALDYVVDFVNTTTGAFSPAVLAKVWIPGWTAATAIDDYVARWVPVTPGLYNFVAIEPKSGANNDQVTEIDAIKAIPAPIKPTREIVWPDLGFGNAFEGSIHGYKFEDLNVNGVDDNLAEPRLPGVTIDLNGVDGQGNLVSLSTVTDDNGEYWFTDLVPGDYTVSEQPPFGTFPTTPVAYAVTLQSRQELVALPGQAMLPAAIFEFPLSGAQEVPPNSSAAGGVCVGILSGDQATFELTCTHDVASPVAAHIHGPGPAGTNAGVVFGLGDPSSPIDATWNLSAANVAELFAGNLYVNVHSAEFPGGEIRGQIVNPQPDPREEVVIGPQLAFGNAFEGSIHGYKFEDLNLNGVRDPGEPALANIEIALNWTDEFGNPQELRTRTNENGEYWFQWLTPGLTYNVSEVPVNAAFILGVNDGALGIADGETFTIDNGVGAPITFEFDFDLTVLPGNVHIPLVPSDSADSVAAKMEQAINISGLSVTTQTAVVGQLHIHGAPGLTIDITNSQGLSLLDGTSSHQTTVDPPPLLITSGKEWVATPEQGQLVQNEVSFPWWLQVVIDPIDMGQGDPPPETLMPAGMGTLLFGQPSSLDPANPNGTFEIVNEEGLPNEVPEQGGPWRIAFTLPPTHLFDPQQQSSMHVHGSGELAVERVGNQLVTLQPGSQFYVDSFFDVFFDITVTDVGPPTAAGPGELIVDLGETLTPREPWLAERIPLQFPIPGHDPIPTTDVRWMPVIFWQEGLGRELLDEAGELWDVLIAIHSTPHVEIEKPARPMVEPLLAFGNAFEGSIHGYKFEDLNGNRSDDNEPRLPGVEIVVSWVDENNRQHQLSTLTDENGEYWFEWLTPGLTYEVTEVAPLGSQQTTENPQPITILSGQEYAALPGQAVNSPMLRPHFPGDGYLEFINPTEHPNLIGTPVTFSPPGVIMTEEFTGYTLANGQDIIEVGDSDTTAGDRADFDWVQENRPVETGFPPGGNHPGMVGAMGWTVSTPEVSPHVDPGTGLPHGHSDEETPPGTLPHLDNGTYALPFFAAVDVFSIISTGQDMATDAAGNFSPRDAALDYEVAFYNSVTGISSPGLLQLVWVPGWTATTTIDDYVARWIPSIPGLYDFVAIEPEGNPNFDQVTEIDAIKAIPTLKPIREIEQLDLAFGNAFEGSIHGIKFNDVDENGAYDSAIDKPWPGVTITLRGDTNGDGQTDVISMPTNDDGEYWFTNLFPGPYTVTETPPLGSMPSTDPSVDVLVTSGKELVALPGQSMKDPSVEVPTPELAFGNVKVPLRFDLNGFALQTEPGFIGVGTGTSNQFNATLGYGWQVASGTFDRFVPTALLRDGHFGGNNTFLVNLLDGDYLVNVTLGDAGGKNDLVNVSAEGNVVLTNIASPIGEFVHHSFTTSVSDGQLDLNFQDLGGDPLYRVNGIEVYPNPQLVHGLSLSGTTVSGTNANPGALITVGITAGTVITADANPNYRGVQVVANASGAFSFDVTPPPLGGNATLSSEEVTGLGEGAANVVFPVGQPRFDLNGSTNVTAAGFIGVGSGTANAYTAARRYGWVTASGTFDRGVPTALLRDAHFGTDNTYLVDLPNGNYVVNVTLGDASSTRDFVDVYAEGALVINNLTSPAGQFVHRSFPVTVGDTQLTLRFDDDGGDPFFAVNGIEVLASQLTHTLTPNGTGTTITGSGATAGSLITVSTSLGSIAPSTLDANPNYAGVQVAADGSGNFSFNITPPSVGGTSTITSEEVTGRGKGSTTFNYVGLGPAVQIIDDDGNGTAVPGFTHATFTGFSGQGFQNDVRFTAGDNTGDTATWTFSVVSGGTYRISATWTQYSNRATDAPYTISGVAGGPITIDINQRVHPNNSAYTFVNDGGTFFADLGVGATYVTTGTTLTISLSDDVTASFAPNDFVIADAVRVERLSPLHAEAATLGDAAVSSLILTADAARPVVNQAIAAWQQADPRAARVLGNVEVIVSDLPQRVLGLASEASRTIWLDTNAAGHGWNVSQGSRVESREIDLLTVVTHELGHLLGLPDLDPTAHAGDLMAARLTAGTSRTPLDVTTQSLTTLDIGRPLSSQTGPLDDLFGSLGRTAFLPSLTARTRDLFTTDQSDLLLDGDHDDDSSLLAREFEADLDHVVADRKSLTDLTGRQRLERERELDELFAAADELLGNFDEKLLD